ncbi:hypothetical protein I203_101089 [Kwoniella mangroviensis CBS 8507]|uniref:uncharacterized protein n=1 Tax=Kwoniella mangroviensis CBS 8507 TaxID=1296122 RepID=UPI00080D00DA|nr:uncharacterized protein I203_02724 [Kwoniella mangroviensis CBS 8507]OCF68065.1 hypothetical protein I203_02724 [Kwoniella mangroviensis CBS 8507]
MTGNPRVKSLSDLPLEIIHLTLNHLQQSHQLGTLASLQRAPKYHYDLTTPSLYKEIIVNEVELAQLILPVIFGKAIPVLCTKLTYSGLSMAHYLQSESSKLCKNLSYTEKITLIQSQFKGNCATPTEGIFSSDFGRAEEEEENVTESTTTFSRTTLFPQLKYVSLQLSKRINPLLEDITRILSLHCNPRSVCVKWMDTTDYEMNDIAGRTRALGEDMLKLMLSFSSNPVNFVIHAAETDFPFTGMGRHEIIRISYRSPFKESTIANQVEMDHLIGFCLNTGSVLSAQESFHIESARIVLPPGLDESVKHATETVKSTAEQFSIDYSSVSNRNDFDITKSYKWIESIQWVYGEEAEKESPCEVCGMSV